MNPRVADLVLSVQLEPTGLGMWVGGPTDGTFESVQQRGGLLQTGRRLWLADVGLGPSPKEVRRAALDLLQTARLQRGAMAGDVEVDLRGGEQIGWLKLRAVRRVLADALGDRAAFASGAKLRIALNSPGSAWSGSKTETYSLVPGSRPQTVP
jgi:hypothetical protein